MAALKSITGEESLEIVVLTAGKYSGDLVALAYNLANFYRFLVTTSRWHNLIEQRFDSKSVVVAIFFLHSLLPFLALDEASFTCLHESISEN